MAAEKNKLRALLFSLVLGFGIVGGLFAQDDFLPDSAKLAIAEGNEAFADGKYKQARNAYRMVIQVSPNHLPALVNLGLTEFYLGNHADAEKLLKQAVQQRIETAPAWLILGLIYLDQNKLDAALAALTQATYHDPKNARAHNFLGVVVGRLGWLEAAEAELRKAIELDEKYADANYNLALFYLDRKSPAIELARRHYRRALELGAEKDPEVEKMLSNSEPSR